jgi:DNA primase small subunit
LNETTREFLRQAYKRYYFNSASLIEFPDDIQFREFGYIPFGGSMIRHISFKSAGEAIAEILRQTPSSVYCSNARYTAPTLPMEEKGWNGAELIFDIDATDVPTQCKRSHDIWYCEDCHSSGKLPKPPKCPECKGGTVELHGTCKVCLDATKDHAERVVGFLIADFGASPRNIRVYFSGNRGYHLHVFDDRFYHLNQQARAEIADYLMGSSLPAAQSIASALRRSSGGGSFAEAGWMRRIWSFVEERKDDYTGTLQRQVSEAILGQRALIDASVTTDVHRVFRLAGTLHGSTGMCKKRVDSIDSFNPEVDSVVLSEEPVKVKVAFYPQFSVGGVSFGPFKSAVVTIPTYAAASILTRGCGEVA